MNSKIKDFHSNNPRSLPIKPYIVSRADILDIIVNDIIKQSVYAAFLIKSLLIFS